MFYLRNMLTLTQLKENTELVREGLRKKHFGSIQLIDEILKLDEERRSKQLTLDTLKAEANKLSKSIGELMKSGRPEEAEDARNRSTQLKSEIKSLEDGFITTEQQIQELLIQLPNVPHSSVPEGKTPEENLEVYRHGEFPTLPEQAKPHWELASQFDLIDFELGVKVTGAGFPVYKGKGARLQRALINYFLDQATAAGYMEIEPPILVNADSGYGTGQLPDKEGQMYFVGLDNLYLAPTAEVPVTNLYRDVLLEESQLPIKNTAYTPCFRREAGSYGAHVRGLNRLHQFDKVEIVQLVKPEVSYQVLEEMRDYVAGLMRSLELPFRIIRLCGGDMSFASALTYDFEVWSAAQERWLEVSSVSNFEAFQANRLKARYRPKGEGKNQLVHTLNGSAMALPRIVAALLENNQTETGIKIPQVLQAYTGFEKIG